VKPGTESGTAALKGKQKIQPAALKKSTQLVAAGFLINAAANVAMVVTVFIASNTPRSTNPQVRRTPIPNQLPDAIKMVPSLTTPHRRKRKALTMEEWKELYEWRIYILYRQAVDY
jgi:hypothetical protein